MGSLMAFVMSSIALAYIVSGYIGVALSSYVEVTETDFCNQLKVSIRFKSYLERNLKKKFD